MEPVFMQIQKNVPGDAARRMRRDGASADGAGPAVVVRGGKAGQPRFCPRDRAIAHWPTPAGSAAPGPSRHHDTSAFSSPDGSELMRFTSRESSQPGERAQ